MRTGMKTICLDTNALMDLVRRQNLRADLSQSVLACRDSLRWLVREERIRVIIPYPAYVEYLSIVRDDTYFEDLRRTEGMSVREALNYRGYRVGKYVRVSQDTRDRCYAQVENDIQELADLTQETRPQEENIDFDFLRRLVLETGLSLKDALILASCIGWGADCILTNDSDFSQELMEKLNQMGMKVPTFVDQRSFDVIGSWDPDTSEGDQQQKSGTNLRRQAVPGCRLLYERVFETEFHSMQDRFVGFFFGLRVQPNAENKENPQCFVWYNEAQGAQQLHEGQSLALLGDMVVRRVKVVEVKRNQKKRKVDKTTTADVVEISAKADFSVASVDPCIHTTLRKLKRIVTEGPKLSDQRAIDVKKGCIRRGPDEFGRLEHQGGYYATRYAYARVFLDC